MIFYLIFFHSQVHLRDLLTLMLTVLDQPSFHGNLDLMGVQDRTLLQNTPIIHQIGKVIVHSQQFPQTIPLCQHRLMIYNQILGTHSEYGQKIHSVLPNLIQLLTVPGKVRNPTNNMQYLYFNRVKHLIFCIFEGNNYIKLLLQINQWQYVYFIDIDEMASFTDNPNALVGIGVLVLLLLIATAALIVVIKLKQKRESKNQGKVYSLLPVIYFHKIL